MEINWELLESDSLRDKFKMSLFNSDKCIVVSIHSSWDRDFEGNKVYGWRAKFRDGNLGSEFLGNRFFSSMFSESRDVLIEKVKQSGHACLENYEVWVKK